jgi:branched-chain amino acid transport system substrate-binding protein
MVRRSGDWRLGTAVAFGATAITLVSGCAAFTEDAAEETILIAADLELTGPDSELGNVYHEALQLRVDQVNQEGVLGDRRLELLVVDNRSDAATSATNLAELAGNPDVTAIVTGGCDACPLAAVDTINNVGVPTIALAAASEITEPVVERQFLFQLGPDASDVARVLAGELDRVEATTIGLVTTDDLYGEEAREEMQTAVDRAGIEIVRSETVSSDDATIEGAASNILAYQSEVDPALGSFQEPPPPGPDAVVMWAPDGATGPLAMALRAGGYEGPFLLDPTAANEVFLNGEAASALNGARMVFTETLVIDGVVATSPAKAARQNWFDDYTAQRSTYHAHSSFAADAVEVIVAAINRGGGADRPAIRSALENTQIDGLTGPIRFRLESHSGLSPQSLVVLVAQGDRWRLATS